MPGTSFHSTTARAPSARASSVAVRSDAAAAERRDAAVGRAADEAGHDRRSCRRRAAAAARRRAQAGRVREVGRGAAVLAVGRDDLDGVDVRRAPAARASSAAASICADMRSPRDTSMSLARGARWPSTPIGAAQLAVLARRGVDRREQLRGAPRRPARSVARDLAMPAQERGRDLRAASALARRRRAAAPSSSRSVTPASADATTTSGP